MALTVSHSHEDQDLDLICEFILSAYWSKGRSADRIRRAVAASCVVGIFENGRQIGFARAFSDMALVAYVMDVFIVEDARGRGLGVRIMCELLAHPDLRDVPVWRLTTEDAQGLYQNLGFEVAENGTAMRLDRSAV
ncbi:acetyltransferase (GNAT) family protein [Aliiruegeria haliotis]|uniref:Acetyltransferase (GNAT) family protein n=1 Tax=Aliiruegeria haliotis TaxID=1280846 RepID=A0A2T0RVQ2_9RHOB|nr:GNAT family N-acetyltransferase [Aliiruegeria haliotis]PRY25244.1 acetyltransferase (GNAT) family protein [Aliiruegeria haliotis]